MEKSAKQPSSMKNVLVVIVVIGVFIAGFYYYENRINKLGSDCSGHHKEAILATRANTCEPLLKEMKDDCSLYVKNVPGCLEMVQSWLDFLLYESDKLTIPNRGQQIEHHQDWLNGLKGWDKACNQ